MAITEVTVSPSPRQAAHLPRNPAGYSGHSPPSQHFVRSTSRTVSLITTYAEESARSMRFPIYESLYVLNRSIEDLRRILEKIGQEPGMPERAFNAYKVDLDYLRSHATQDVLEVMNNREIDEMARLGKQKKAYEDSIRDLDDVYFEVHEREEQRRKQGLPSLIGVLRGYQPAGSLEDAATPPPALSKSSARFKTRTKSTRRNRRRSDESRTKHQSRRTS